jgi:hypothetical protein
MVSARHPSKSEPIPRLAASPPTRTLPLCAATSWFGKLSSLGTCLVAPLEGAMASVWRCRPDDSVWEGGTFNLTLTFSEEYPKKPPEVIFVSKLFHPNIYNDGRICLDILQSKWSPVNTVQAVLVSIQVRPPRPHPTTHPLTLSCRVCCLIRTRARLPMHLLPSSSMRTAGRTMPG